MEQKNKQSDKANKTNKIIYRNEREKRNFLWRILFFPLSMMYLEFVFHIGLYGFPLDETVIYPCIFGLALGMVWAIVSCALPKIGNIITSFLMVAGSAVYELAQFIYNRIFDTFFGLSSVKGADNAMNFKVFLYQNLRENVLWIVLIVLPIVVLIVLSIFVISYERPKKKGIITLGACAVLVPIAAVFSLQLGGTGSATAYGQFHGRFAVELSMNRLGITVSTLRDAYALTGLGESRKSSIAMEDETEATTEATTEAQDQTEASTEEEIVYKEQIDESINFSKLYDSTDDQDLKNLTAYMAHKTPTMENEYTGMFEGYNVVFITAESLSKYAVNEEWTPTLYKIMNEGFVFENYYNPRWYHSTIDGEYVNCLSQYPISSDWMFYRSSSTYQPYALGNALNTLGYSSYAYHDYDSYYYDRTQTHSNMGYDFKAIGNGLEIPYYGIYSDLDTMEASYEEFTAEEPFNMYFMTFSGHLPYDYYNQDMGKKNREEGEKVTEGLGYPEELVCYIGAQMELDHALEFLIEKLDEQGELDNTVFIISPDHYPYGISDENYNLLAGSDVSSDTFELHHSCLGIWSASMDEKVVVDKKCASVDILPTVLNLLGYDYDSRLLSGHDILSDASPLIIFADNSFMTDELEYNATTGEITYFVDESEVPDDYVDNKIEEVDDILYYSEQTINTDYFRFVFEKDDDDEAVPVSQ